MMRRSRAVVYVSEYEGFGRPPVEAVLNGACPVYSDLPPLREVMQGAGHAFSNGSSDEFGRAMDAALRTGPGELAAWGAQLLARHSWPRVLGSVLEGLGAQNPV